MNHHTIGRSDAHTVITAANGVMLTLTTEMITVTADAAITSCRRLDHHCL